MVGIAALAKGAGGLLAVLGKLSFLKSFLSIAFLIWSYGASYGWIFGVGVVLLIFIHEMGHYVIARRHGYGADLPAFRLFFAFVRTHSPPPNATVYDSSMISFAGPVWGGIAGLLCLVAFYATGEKLFTALAYFSFFLNLINMIPVRPLDGGGIVAALRRPPASVIGTPYAAYYTLTAAQRWTVGLGYLLTIAALIGLLVIAHHLPGPASAPGSYSSSPSHSF